MPRGMHNWNYVDVKKKLKEFGFSYAHSRGSHHYYRAFINKKLHIVTVPFHGTKKAIKTGTMKSIMIQSGIDKDKWLL